MIIQTEKSRILNSLPSSRAYFNPSLNENLINFSRILPLLIDNVLIYVNKNSPHFTKLNNKVKDLFEEGLFIPVAIEDSYLPKNYLNTKFICRKNILDESLFSIDYKDALERDYEDNELRNLIGQQFNLSGSKLSRKLNSISFSINWDLIFTQIIETPVITDLKTRAILSYKGSDIIKSYYYPQSLNFLPETKNFMDKINPVLPSNLDVDKIKQFKKEKITIQFRNWLEKSIYSAYEKQNFDTIKIDDYLIKQFNEMSRSYTTNANLIGTGIAGFVGGILGHISFGSAVGAVGGSLVESVGGHPLSKIVKQIWKKTGPNRWVFLITEIE